MCEEGYERHILRKVTYMGGLSQHLAVLDISCVLRPSPKSFSAINVQIFPSTLVGPRRKIREYLILFFIEK